MVEDVAEAEGLEGKLSGVDIGDVILISGPTLNIAGYVTSLDITTIKLSVEDPYLNNWLCRSVLHPFNPARTYRLERFKGYKILKKAKE